MNRMHGRNRLSTAIAGILCLGLAACGGGGGGGLVASNPPPPVTPPPTTGPGFTPTIATDSTLTAVAPPTLVAEAAPATFADPNLAKMHVLINSAGALGAGKIGSGVTIGFVDSGVNRNHPSLIGRVTANFVHVGSGNDLSVDDKVGHGTTVASLAAGKSMSANYLDANNQIVRTSTWPGGVAQGAGVVSSRIISDKPPVDDGSGQGGNEILAGQGYGGFFRSINAELAGAGARIINNSWGGLYWNDPNLTIELATAWKDFVVNRGGIVVFANGNDGANANLRPNPSNNAALPSMHGGDPVLEKGWLTVGALDPNAPTQLTGYSQECGIAKNYCMVAPGNVVITKQYDSSGQYGLYNGGGTSYAAPQVAGAAAVVWAQYSYFSNDLVRQTLLGTAKDLGAPGVDSVFGWGLLDVTKAANGPGNFAWGDVTVSFSGNSVWRNAIVGAGGLIKQGSGLLSLTEAQQYTGDTRVQAGGLDIRNGLASSNLSISNGATVFASGAFGRSVSNDGRFFNGRDTGATITGNYGQTANGNLGVWLGTPLRITGIASLGGQVSILGTRSGYTTSARETLLTATGGVSGTFSRVAAAPNVFLDASLGYDANNVFLNINRISITAAAASMGLTAASQLSATRVEAAMGVIDAGGGAAAFVGGAGDIQGVLDARAAEASLRSLSGQMHAANAALTLEAMDSSRRSLGERFERLAGRGQLQGSWARDLARNGALQQAGFNGVDYRMSGWMLGHDVRLTPDAVVGFAAMRMQGNGWMSELGDRTRSRQTEAQAYAGWLGEDAYLHGALGAGRFDREVERTLLLGYRREGVNTLQGGRYLFANLESGYRLDAGGFAVTPYLGAHYAMLQDRGFDEAGADGFGLRSAGGRLARWQGYAGLRAAREWTLASGLRLALDARSEWQRADGGADAIMASFTGVEQWLPIGSMALARNGRVHGVGLSAEGRGGQWLRVDYSRRADDRGRDGVVHLRYLRGF